MNRNPSWLPSGTVFIIQSRAEPLFVILYDLFQGGTFDSSHIRFYYNASTYEQSLRFLDIQFHQLLQAHYILGTQGDVEC